MTTFSIQCEEQVTRITASVVLYNTPEQQLIRLMDCIQTSEVCERVYLIDNSPEPHDLSLYHLPWVTYLRSEKNNGYGAGHNIALRLILDTSEFHFVLNPDIYFDSTELEQMIHRIKNEPSIGQLMPKITYPDGSIQYLCKLLPNPMDLLFRRFLWGPFRTLAKRQLEKFELRFTGYDQEMNVPFLSGCFMLFRMSALRDIGLFDESFFMYAEDIDISRRMHTSYQTLYFPQAEAIHDHARASYTSPKMLFIHIRSLITYFNKWGWLFDSQRKSYNQALLDSIKNKSLHTN